MLCHDSTYRAVSGYITPSYATHPRAHNVRPYGLYRDKTQFSAPDYILQAIPHNSKCRYGERGTADAKPKAQIILDAAKVSAASGGNSEPKQGQRSQSARGFCPRSTMRVPQPDIIEHFGNADAVPQPPERCLSRKAGIMRCCPKFDRAHSQRFGGASFTPHCSLPGAFSGAMLPPTRHTPQ